MTTTRLAVVALVLLLELLAAPVAAQTVRADRVTLNAGPCVITSGSAAPNGSRVGNVCDTFIQTTSGAIWTKTSGTGTSSGWIATLAGTGTPGTLPVWTSASAIGDSIIAQAGGVATITGAEHVTGNSTIGGTVDVTGAATLRSNLDVTGAATLRADTSISGNTVLGGWIGSLGYASQVSGWRITQTGAADVRYLFTDELRAKLFTADAESVLAGSMRVTKSYSTVAQPFTCPAAGAAGTLWVYDASTYGDAPVFQANDFLVIHVLARAAFGPFTITDCVGAVTAYADGSGANAGQQSWTFTRATGANGGAMTGGTVVAVNQLVQDMGVSGNGYVEISAVDGAGGINAPYIQTNIWNVAPVAANTSTMCRLGNLNGVAGAGPEYGLLCGTINGGAFRLSNITAQFHNIPVEMYDGATQVFRLDPAGTNGPYLALGSPLPTNYSAGTGVWMGKDTGGAYKLRIGNPTGNRLTWDGNQLVIAGEGSGITNINGGNIQAGTITAGSLNIVGHPGGAALNPDPNTSDLTMWPVYAGWTPASIATISDGMVGSTSLRSTPNNGQSIVYTAGFPIDPTKTYRWHLWARSAGTPGSFPLIFSVSCFNGARADIGWVGVLNSAIPTAWTEYHGLLTPAMMVAGTRQAGLVIQFNWTGQAGGTTGYMEAQDIRFEEALPSTLITPGAITTTQIAAKTITAANIASNAITVGEINASGFGDNLIKNSTFEGTAATALAGWEQDPYNGGTGTVTQSCCGTRGPGTMLLTAATGGTLTGAEYFATPMTLGQPYRVAVDVYSGAATSGGFFVMVLESAVNTMPRWVQAGGAPLPGNVTATATTYLCNNCALAAGWNHVEYTYTPTGGATVVSLAVYDGTCAGFGGPCGVMHFDNVEMQPQLGAGHIRANSITADRLVANSITSAQIAAGTITSTQIAAGTITGGNIAGGTITGGNIAGRTITAGALVANTITSNEIGVRAIVAGNIATGTLTANELAANTITGDRIAAGTIVGGNIAGNTISAYNIQASSITADKLSVGSLSAISANLGTVNAGTITGVTINGTTINGSTFTGGQININSGTFQVDSSGNVTSNGSASFNGTMNVHALNAGYNAGGVSTVNFNGEVYIAAGMGLTLNVLSGSGNRLVCTNNNGRLYTSAANGSC